MDALMTWSELSPTPSENGQTQNVLIRNCPTIGRYHEHCFSTSKNVVFTSQEHAARTEVTYNLLDGMNRLAMGTILSSSFTEHGLHAYTLPPPRWAHVDCQKREADLLGVEGGWLQKPSMVLASRDEWQIVHSTSSLLNWATMIMLVLDMEALRLVHR